jgi:hypothetical protein
LLEYLHKRSFEEWPETDLANNKLLFNLVFYSIGDSAVRSHSLSVFYEKAPIPVVYIPDIVSETVRTPKLSGKGKDVMSYLARDPSLSRDPSILRFDQGRFDQSRMTIRDAFVFAEKLFELANTKLPLARVSKTFDCAMLSHQDGFQWLDASVKASVRRRSGPRLPNCSANSASSPGKRCLLIYTAIQLSKSDKKRSGYPGFSMKPA